MAAANADAVEADAVELLDAAIAAALHRFGRANLARASSAPRLGAQPCSDGLAEGPTRCARAPRGAGRLPGGIRPLTISAVLRSAAS